MTNSANKNAQKNGVYDSFYIVGMGSSMGDRLAILRQAHRELQPLIVNQSAIYESPPFGGIARNPFLNACVLLKSSLNPEDLLAALNAVETKLGRTRRLKWEDRLIDLDILLAFDAQRKPLHWTSTGLCIPHPSLRQRPFAWMPSLDVVADWPSPFHNGTMREEQFEGDRNNIVRVDASLVAPVSQQS